MKTTTPLRQTGPCTFTPPPNNFGIRFLHWTGSPPPDREFIGAVLSGHVTASEPALQAELRKPAILTPDEARELGLRQ